jgi:hypothetical protein
MKAEPCYIKNIVSKCLQKLKKESDSMSVLKDFEEIDYVD